MIKNLFHKKIWKYFIFILEFLILCVAFFVLQNQRTYNSVDEGISLRDWSSQYITYDNGWYVDPSLVDTNDEVFLLHGPNTYMPKGDYTVKIWYECDYDQIFCPYSTYGQEYYIESGNAILDKTKTYVSYDFSITEDLDDLDIIIKYNGEGTLRISNIEIESNAFAWVRWMILLAALFLLSDILWLTWPKISKRKNLFFALAGIIFISSLPILAKGMNLGHDLPFHLMRIEGIAQELKYGQFPVRIASDWLSGYGYSVPIYYSDLFLYIPALLRIAGFSIISVYKLYILFVNTLTVLLSFLCFNKIFRHRNIALLTTLAYCLSSYRMLDIFIRSAVGEYTAMAFLPVIALALYNIYTDDSKNWKDCIKNALILAFGMTGIIQSHILTTEMVVILMVIICLFLWKKTFRLSAIKVYILAIVATIGMNLFYLLPFLDYYKNVPALINDPVTSEAKSVIQFGGAYLFQYFSFFQNPYGGNTISMNNRMALTPGLLLMVVLVLAIFLWWNKKADQKIKLMTILSVLVLFIASNLFPWNYLAKHFQAGKLLAQVQFPWRYIGIATILLSILFGFVLKKLLELYSAEKMKDYFIGAAIAGISTVLIFFGQYTDGMNMINYYDVAEIDTISTIAIGEYLPLENTIDTVADLDYTIHSENMDAPELISREGTKMVLHCKTEGTQGTVYVPMFNYKGYQATDDSGESISLFNGPHGQIAFHLPAGYEGTITVEFVAPWYWHVAELISLLTILALIAYAILARIRRKKQVRKRVRSNRENYLS